MQKLVFFFPWKEVSGGPYYLCQLADAAAESGKFEVYYTDFYNGLSDHYLESFSVRKLPFSGKVDGFPVFPNEPVIIVMPIYWYLHMPLLHPDSKIVFFNWHNECIPVLQREWKTSEVVLNAFLEMIRDTRAVFFLDKSHLLAQNRGNIRFEENIVPIIIPRQERLARRELVDPDAYNIAILGRLARDKIFAYLDLLKSIEELELDKPVNIHLIGDGKSNKLFWDNVQFPSLNIIPYGTLPLEKVHEVLREKVDVLFSMGKSVLEGGSLALPSVIIPNEIYEFHCNHYSFLFESEGYAVGWGTNQIAAMGVENRPVAEILDMVYGDPGAKGRLGEQCREYCLKNHRSNLAAFLHAVDCSTFTYQTHIDFQSYLVVSKIESKSVRLRRKLSTILGAKKKSLSLFGIPLYILTQRDPSFYNFYLTVIPLLQIERRGKKTAVRLLPLVWAEKVLRKLLARPAKPITPVLSLPHAQTEEGHNALRRRIEDKLQRGEPIKVCLFEARIGCWQFDRLYHLLEDDPRFQPTVVVIPFLTMGMDAMVEYMETSYEAFVDKDYRVVKGYDKETGVYLDIQKELAPDAVFYTMFWEHHFNEMSYISRFEDIYSFLYPYGFDVYWFPDRQQMNFELQNKVTRYYLPTPAHKNIAQDNMDNGGKNVFITGSPKLDPIIDPDYRPQDVWKLQPGKVKRIIWAPHHSLKEKEPYCQLCAFLELSDFMLKMARRYNGRIQFAFKPHPMLKPRLYDIWGKRRTDEYYQAWADGPNTQLETGEFIDLFLTSDAMILDSVSFVAEYTYTGKPAFFTYAEGTRFPTNKFGTAVMKHLYKNELPDTLFKDIAAFLRKVVLNEDDPKKEARQQFVQDYMLPPNGKFAAENIYDDLCRIIIEDKFQ